MECIKMSKNVKTTTITEATEATEATDKKDKKDKKVSANDAKIAKLQQQIDSLKTANKDLSAKLKVDRTPLVAKKFADWLAKHTDYVVVDIEAVQVGDNIVAIWDEKALQCGAYCESEYGRYSLPEQVEKNDNIDFLAVFAIQAKNYRCFAQSILVGHPVYSSFIFPLFGKNSYGVRYVDGLAFQYVRKTVVPIEAIPSELEKDS